MNATLTTTDKEIINYTAMGGWAFFIISELLPFFKKGDKGNGLLHGLVCILKGSKCMTDNILKAIDKEAPQEKEEEPEGTVVKEEVDIECGI